MIHDLALAAHAYYAGEMTTGRRACERLLAAPLEPGLERIVRRNRTWYTQPLEDLAAVTLHRLDVDPARPGWSIFNPSLVPHGSGFLVNVRSSNYRIEAGRYVIPPADGDRIRTENILASLSADLAVERSTVLAADYPASDYPVEGLEDVRLNQTPAGIVASATLRNLAGHDGTCRIATADLDVAAGRLESIRCPETPNGRHEKNWMPISGRREWVYAASAGGRLHLAKPDADGWQLTAAAAMPHAAASWRGGSQLVPADDGRWLALVHEVALADDGRRIYEHRLVAFDESAGWTLAGCSPPFVFREPRSIEFAAGLARDGDRLVASFGVRDAEAWLAVLPLADALEMVAAK